jgi:hypothetical protein
MVSLNNYHNKLSFSEGGQGTLETILALPVLLTLITAILQIALISMAQILLQYAAYSAARTGLVRNFDLKEMKTAAGRILVALPGVTSFGGYSFDIQVAILESEDSSSTTSKTATDPELMQIIVNVDFPLVVPLAGKIFSRNPLQRTITGYPVIELAASWNISSMYTSQSVGER